MRLLLAVFVLGGLAVLGVGSVVLLTMRRTRPRSWGEAAAVAGVALLAALGAGVMSGTTDDAVVVHGATRFCWQLVEEEPLPADVQDRCDAQRRDRIRQAVLAASGAAISAAGGVCLVTGYGPLSRRRRDG